MAVNVKSNPLLGSRTAVADADIRLITGKQRSGKSNTGVASAADDYYSQLTGIVSPNGEMIKAQALTKDDKKYLTSMGVNHGVHKHVRVFSDDGKQSKIIQIPKGFIAVSPVKIFANFHLYGMRYAYISLADILQYTNTELFNDSWILSDESVMTDARNSMEMAGKLIAQWGASAGKRNAHLCFMVQYNNMIELRFRLFATTRIECSYNLDYKIITCEVKKAGKPPYSYDYYAPNYWRYFNTNELIPIPQDKIDKALTRIYAGGSPVK